MNAPSPYDIKASRFESMSLPELVGECALLELKVELTEYYMRQYIARNRLLMVSLLEAMSFVPKDGLDQDVYQRWSEALNLGEIKC